MSTARIPVLYVAGSGHTGSTLLALLLDSHPHICCIGESAIKPSIVRRGGMHEQRCSCGRPVDDCPFWSAVFRGMHARGFPMSAAHWSNEYRFSHPLAQRLFSRACRSEFGQGVVTWAADHLPVYSGRLVRTDRANVAFAQAILDASNTRVFADTSKRLPRLIHLLRIPELDIRLVRLVRDVRGYAASAKRRGESARDAARTWLVDQRAFGKLQSTLDPARVHLLKYEDLCGDVDGTMRALFRFAGVEDIAPPATVDASDHHVLGNSMRLGGRISVRVDQSWRERLDPAEVADILGIAGSMNGSLGYV